ncbi:MAG: hydroxylamine reductase [Pirellulaceae bacterium]|nr:hydroxylamine reductase [Pirellulaceae bacterium]
MSMFCYQCQETKNNEGCTVKGVCGKEPEVALLEDQIIRALKRLSVYAHAASKAGQSNKKLDEFILKSIFTTVTNVNFDPTALKEYIQEILNWQEVVSSWPEISGVVGPPNEDLDTFLADVDSSKIILRWEEVGEDITSLQELLVYGIKGMAAYAYHALMLGKETKGVASFVYKAFSYLYQKDQKLEELIALCMECGEVNYNVMETLDRANTDSYGHPEPTEVNMRPVVGKCLLVSGHDLKDLEEILKQTAGKGINVYTNGEMLPAHAYPELKKYRHLVGNYGGAWYKQTREFDKFPGPIVMTSNCIQKPKASYIDRIFTCGPVGWPGVKHLDTHDYSAVIEKALECEGFTEDEPAKKIIVGFAHNTVLSVADKVIEAVQEGALKHIFLVGGCDGHSNEREYYNEFTKAVPDDALILTLGCAKYRFHENEFGDIGGIPRLLDMGQCNDAFSAIKVASALAEAFDTDVNSLPLTLNISWYEQKAACILLTLLHLGIKNIHLGPTLPAFLSPTVLGYLVENFQISPISTVEADLEKMLPASV